jgi:hypothetical protein
MSHVDRTRDLNIDQKIYLPNFLFFIIEIKDLNRKHNRKIFIVKKDH